MLLTWAFMYILFFLWPNNGIALLLTQQFAKTSQFQSVNTVFIFSPTIKIGFLLIYIYSYLKLYNEDDEHKKYGQNSQQRSTKRCWAGQEIMEVSCMYMDFWGGQNTVKLIIALQELSKDTI